MQAAGDSLFSSEFSAGWRPRAAMSRRWFLAALLLAAIAGESSLARAGETFPPPAAAESPPSADSAAAEPQLEYNRDVRPILADACFTCHGPDSAARQADLRLDRREAAIDLGAIVPGDADASELIRRIESTDEAELMPPPETKKTLTPEQRRTLALWIRQGAEYQPHWSLIAPQRPAPPSVNNEWWVRNPIDRFIAARLEAKGLSPAPEAERRALARRVTLDLTGLPPTPDQLDRFVNDPAPDAYEQFVERLLASPRWGEHRGRYWLDVARYGDTHGIHFDNFREMWSYRDWVIGAFNANMPYDRFTIENLAGDLLPDATLENRIASGFNRCNITTNEGGAIAEEYLVLYDRDRTETTAQAFLGLTAGCAVCHDHKFDPLSQKEFYQLAAFFNNTTQAAMDGNVRDTPPVEVVTLPTDRPRWNELAELVPTAQRRLDERAAAARARYDAWLGRATPPEALAWVPSRELRLHVPLDDAGPEVRYQSAGTTATVAPAKPPERGPGFVGRQATKLAGEAVVELPDEGDLSETEPFSYAAWIHLTGGDTGGALLARMDDRNGFRGWDFWLENNRIGSHILHAYPDNALKVLTKTPLPAGKWVHVALTYDGGLKARGVKVFVDGVSQPLEVPQDSLSATIHATVPLKIGQRHSGQGPKDALIQDVRIYNRALTDDEALSLAQAPRVAGQLALPDDKRDKAALDAAYPWWLAVADADYGRLLMESRQLLAEQEAIRRRGTVAHVMHEKDEAAVAYILQRGEYDQRGEKVEPATPALLPPMDPALPRNRFGLAQWIMAPENPLPARVAVNRFWQEVFGVGLVKTAGDFGVSGQLPSHPELLDWLAVEFRESGWDVKQLFRLIVASAAYRQSAAVTPEKLAADPDNRLLSRGPRFRMDAEMVRDLALASSGLLDPNIGGPSVKPYQPPGVWEAVAMIGSDTRFYEQDHGQALYRRSMYTLWKRSAPPASMEVFNAPNRETCTMARERTNTPLQAMVTLNDPQFVEAARRLAENVLRQQPTDAAKRRQAIALQLLGRRLRPQEEQILAAATDDLLSHYRSRPEEAKRLVTTGESAPSPDFVPAELAAWTMTASEVMNLDETVNK